MGHDFIKYEGKLERFNDFDLWSLRHFFLEEARRLEIFEPSFETKALREFFERWSWPGPGVFMGADFSEFIAHRQSRWELTLRVMQRAADRIAEFGEHVPLLYLQQNINTPSSYYTRDQPTKPFLIGIGKICKLLSEPKPQED